MWHSQDERGMPPWDPEESLQVVWQGQALCPSPHPRGFQRAQALASTGVLRSQWCVCISLCHSHCQATLPRGAGSKGEGEKARTGRFMLIEKSFKSAVQWNTNGWMSRWCLCTCVGMGVGPGQHYRLTGSQGIRSIQALAQIFLFTLQPGESCKWGWVGFGVFSLYCAGFRATLLCMGKVGCFYFAFFLWRIWLFDQGENLSNVRFRLPRNYKVLESIKA